MSRKIRLSAGEIKQAIRDEYRRILTDLAGWRKKFDDEAFNAFDELVEKRCDPMFLATRLVFLNESHRADTWKGLTGFADPDTLRTALKRLRLCADDVDRFVAAVLGKSMLQDRFVHALPTRLRDLADRVERTVKVITPSRNPTNRAARADIVRHVEDRTGGPNDRLVAAILNPALGCDERAQGQWRHDNRGIILAVRGT